MISNRINSFRFTSIRPDTKKPTFCPFRVIWPRKASSAIIHTLSLHHVFVLFSSSFYFLSHFGSIFLSHSLSLSIQFWSPNSPTLLLLLNLRFLHPSICSQQLKLYCRTEALTDLIGWVCFFVLYHSLFFFFFFLRSFSSKVLLRMPDVWTMAFGEEEA